MKNIYFLEVLGEKKREKKNERWEETSQSPLRTKYKIEASWDGIIFRE